MTGNTTGYRNSLFYLPLDKFELFQRRKVSAQEVMSVSNREAFFERLSAHIHMLTGQKPRIAVEKQDEGVDCWRIYRK